MLHKDPILLMSVVNTKLRDRYPSLDALLDDLNVPEAEIAAPLAAAGYVYDPARNQFVLRKS